MNTYALYHQAKSNMSYAFDENTLYLWLQTAKGDKLDISVIAGDPFTWGPKDDNPKEWEWKHSNATESKMQKKYSTDLFDFYFLEYKPPYKRTNYAFLITEDDKQYLYGANYLFEIKDGDKKMYDLSNYFNYPCINPTDVIDTPSWVKDTIWYQIFPDRFCNGNPDINPKDVCKWEDGFDNTVTNHMQFGGDLQGIINKLDYLVDLGINGIYFNPIFEAGGTHKYDTTDYYKIDPVFGTNEEFKKLVDLCHEKGIKIMLDAVFNHCGWLHAYFQDVVKNGKDSPYYECFNIRKEPMINFPIKDGLPVYSFKNFQEAPNFDTFAFTPFMPKWNTDNPVARKHLLDVTTYWTKEYNIDGWRLDVSNEVSHDFWREFKKVVRSINPDTLILGENWNDSNPWISNGQMDAVMNYGLLNPIWQFFGPNNQIKIDGENFMYQINKLILRYQANINCNMFNLLGCHDTARILNVCAENKKLLRLPYIFLFTFTGSPNIYYGDEIGLTGANDPDNRRTMPWDESLHDLDLKQFIKTLIKLRKEIKAFKSVDVIWKNTLDNVIVYEKQSDEETITIILNNNNEKKTLNLPYGTYINLLTNEKLTTDSFTLDNYEYYILKNIK